MFTICPPGSSLSSPPSWCSRDKLQSSYWSNVTAPLTLTASFVTTNKLNVPQSVDCSGPCPMVLMTTFETLSDLKISGCQENWYALCRQLGISLQGDQESLVIIVINTFRISPRQHRRGWLSPSGTRGRSPGSWWTPWLPRAERGTQDSCPPASAQADGHQWGEGESGLMSLSCPRLFPCP